MSASHPPPPFNRLASDLDADLARPEYRAVTGALADLCVRFARMGRTLRRDVGRAWENAHVLVEFERLVLARAGRAPIRRVLDVGGGNSPLAYHLAERGFHVAVVDTDPAVVQTIAANGRELQWHDRLTAQCPVSGRFPWRDESFDCVFCISVLEGVLRKDRARLFAEIGRTLRRGGSLLLTFDYGAGARCFGDPPTSLQEIDDDVVRASGLELVGDAHELPVAGRAQPPVVNAAPSLDGRGDQRCAYTFGAVHLRRRD